jgi:hypothetical protein
MSDGLPAARCGNEAILAGRQKRQDKWSARYESEKPHDASDRFLSCPTICIARNGHGASASSPFHRCRRVAQRAAASEKLDVTQPAISRQVQDLEDAIGVALSNARR